VQQLGAAAERPRFHMVVVAASAGGLSALAVVLARLPADFPVPIAIVQHLDPDRHSLLAEILGRRTSLVVKEAAADEVFAKGIAYVAPPGHHLLVAAGGIAALTHTARVHFVRPSADRLFQSVAISCSPAIAVVLTGTGTDGAAGVTAIKTAGGVAIVQDLATSAFAGMPQAAIDTGAVDFVLPLDDIGPRLVELTRWS
jgi:two-component system, chemotaxis family, protein-glutamate methylesterase/glutaminase